MEFTLQTDKKIFIDISTVTRRNLKPDQNL